jgi:hypothetical protein
MMTNYNNLQCLTGTSILEFIRDSLINSGWTLISDDAANGFIKLQGNTSNNDSCWVEFILGNHADISHPTIKVRGDLLGNNVNYSGFVYAQYQENNNNIVYLTSDSDSFGLFIQCSSPESTTYGSAGGGIHGGFLNRFIDYASDPFAWAIGYIHSFTWERQIAKSAHSGTIWQQHNKFTGSFPENPIPLYDSLNNGVDQFPQVYSAEFLGTIDRFTKSSYLYKVGINTLSNPSDITNPSMCNFNGGVNPLNDLPVLDTMYINEGSVSSGGYPLVNGMPVGLYYRGEIKHCYVGGASLPYGTILEDRNNAQYISCGNEGWQVLKIS